MAKKKVNKGLQTYNLIRSELSAQGKEIGQPLGSGLNSRASELYAQYKAKGYTQESIQFLVEESFRDVYVDWFNLHNVTLGNDPNLDKKIIIDNRSLGPEGSVLETSSTDANQGNVYADARKEVRPAVNNESGLKYKLESTPTEIKLTLTTLGRKTEETTPLGSTGSGAKKSRAEEEFEASNEVEIARIQAEEETKRDVFSSGLKEIKDLLKEGFIDQATFKEMFSELLKFKK